MNTVVGGRNPRGTPDIQILIPVDNLSNKRNQTYKKRRPSVSAVNIDRR